MAKGTEDHGAALNVADLGAVIAAGIAQGIASIAPAKELKEGDPEYTERLKAEGFYDEFERPVYQNGYAAQARGLSEQTRHRASHLKAGRYINGRVSVDVDGHGAVYLRYPTTSESERMRNLLLWRSFDELIDKIWTEMHPAA